MRALLGAGFCGSAAHSAGGRAISAVFPPERHGTVLAIRHTAIPLGGVVGGLLVPLGIDDLGLASTLSVVAVACACAAAALWIALAGLTAPRLAAHEVGVSPTRVPALWLLASGCAALAFVQLGLASFLTLQLVDDAGLAVGAAAGAFAMVQLLGAAARVGLGVWSDRVPDRIVLLQVLAVTGALVTSSSSAATSGSARAALLCGALVIVTSWNGIAVAAMAALAPPGRTGATLGMQTTCNAASGTVAPIAVGALLHWAGWPAVGWAFTASLLFAACSFAALRRSGRACAPGAQQLDA